jgi:hypothetical protein
VTSAPLIVITTHLIRPHVTLRAARVFSCVRALVNLPSLTLNCLFP